MFFGNLKNTCILKISVNNKFRTKYDRKMRIQRAFNTYFFISHKFEYLIFMYINIAINIILTRTHKHTQTHTHVIENTKKHVTFGFVVMSAALVVVSCHLMFSTLRTSRHFYDHVHQKVWEYIFRHGRVPKTRGTFILR